MYKYVYAKKFNMVKDQKNYLMFSEIKILQIIIIIFNLKNNIIRIFIFLYSEHS